MKKLIYIAVICVFPIFNGCNNEDAPDCLKTAGNKIEIALEVKAFSKIEINNEFNVLIRQGAEQSVSLRVGKNLVPDIQYTVKENLFSITNNSSCNWVRSYDFPELIITHPNIDFIRQNGGGLIKSEGQLTYPTLSLISEQRSGDINLNIDCNNFRIVSNALSNFYISGSTSNFYIFFAAGDGRFEGENLVAKKATVNHRGSNEIIVQVTDSLSGNIWSSGNIIMRKTRPAAININDENLGRLIDETE